MISFSGIDCSGKSTQISLLCKELEKDGKPYRVVWSRGGYTPGIDFIKRCLRRGKKLSKEERISYSQKTNENAVKRRILFLAGLVDLLLFYSITLRIWNLQKTIICDRYIWDTYIDYKMRYPDYQFENSFLWKLLLKTMVKPKVSLCLTIPAEMSMYRSTLKEEPFPETVEVRKKRIEMYMREISNGRWQHVIDATQSIESVFSSIVRILRLGDENDGK